MKRLINLIKTSKYVVVFTGAGISTLSGIKDFRGKNGIYKSTSVDAEKIFSLPYFMKDPSYYYTHTKDFIYDIDRKEPNIIHRELARLEKLGMVKAVITQNIDMLHQKASSKNVVELHGSPAVHRCLSCGMEYPYKDICDILDEGIIPRCKSCQGLVKPDIIFFGEALNERSVNMAVSEASKSDLLIVLGSSLIVQPAASIPFYTLDNGGKIIIINDMETPLDSNACLRYSDLEECFNYIAENL